MYNMSETEFCYWLQGFFELSGSDELTPAQIQMIKSHLNLVFKKVTRIIGDGKWEVDINTMFTGITSQGLCGVSPLSDTNQRKYC